MISLRRNRVDCSMLTEEERLADKNFSETGVAIGGSKQSRRSAVGNPFAAAFMKRGMELPQVPEGLLEGGPAGEAVPAEGEAAEALELQTA